jgi:hypothetical protein
MYTFGVHGLLEQRQQNGHDDARFQTFSEADEEDCGIVSAQRAQQQRDLRGTAKTLTILTTLCQWAEVKDQWTD